MSSFCSHICHKSDDNYRRDSFENRFCDDLSQVLLQFLPIKDKFKLECVSKQFQRTVFQRQYDLDLGYFFGHNITEILEKLVKKLPNIKSFKYYNSCEDINDSDIDIIVKYCHKLTKIYLNCDLSQISSEKRDSFVEKFGEKLVSTEVNNNKSIDWLCEAFPKLEELEILYCHWFESNRLLSIRLNSLNKLKITLNDFNESSQIFDENFKQFIENNKHLIHLDINMSLDNQNSLNSFFNNISKMDHLVYLHIIYTQDIFAKQDINSIINGLRQLSDKCLKIKSFNVFNDIKSSDQLKSFMTEVKLKFKALERLQFNLDLENNSELQPFEEYFRGLESLTHLIVLINTWTQNRIKNDFLINIDKSLPKLRVLILRFGSIEVSEQSLDSLARLPRLELLEMVVKNKSIGHLIIDKIQKNCTKIKIIDIRVDMIPEED